MFNKSSSIDRPRCKLQHRLSKVLLTLASGIVAMSMAVPALAQTRPLAPGVRGLATRAPGKVVIDGDLSEFKDAFSTPVNYFHPDQRNRPAQFFYMWDDEAFYAGLRTLDQKRADPAPDDRLWEGDAVEWYFDTRRGDNFRSTKWTNDGAVHCYWTGLTGNQIKPRFCLRPGYLNAIPKIGVEVGARKTSYGMEVEFKLPWKNFPNFSPKAGEVIALDAEICYSDGKARVDRYFAYGSPLSVQQPASQAKIELVDRLERDDWKACGPVLMPLRCDVPWEQPTKGQNQAMISLPPNHADQVGKIIFRLTDLDDKAIGDFEAEPHTMQAEGHFARAVANWPLDTAPAGGYHVTAIVYDKSGQELTRVAPRLVSTSMQQGY